MSDTVQLPSSPVAGPEPGDLIAGRYRLERELGRGAMGTVWAAMHTTLGQRVAIKLIVGEKARSADARQRFSVEAKAAARLRSRHVVHVYDDGETADGMPYIVMEYLDGQTLEERLEANRDMSLGEAVRIATHAGRALARAHAQGIVHRDLKSGNIFIAKSEDDELGWVAKVLDFGVAKLLNDGAGPSATRTGTIVGTPLFMSPEQIRGAGHVDHRADLYSLGMVFYNMVTGSHAFDGPSYSDVLVAICTQTLPDIRVAAPWLPPALGAWFDKACARERDERFQSADEMIEALQQAAGPASRLTRPSVPDEISGPSGTLVGHVPPHAAATLLANDFSHPAPSIAHAPPTPRSAPPSPSAEPSPSSSAHGTTLRSTPTEPLAPARHPRRESLWVWGASGVGLAVVTVALGLVVSRTSAWFDRPAPKLESTGNIAATAIPVPQDPVPPANIPREQPLPAAVTASPAPVTTAPAATTPSQAPLADARGPTTRHAASTVRRAAPVAHAAPKAQAAVTPAKPPAAPPTPDMGF